jgi:hypothetical protein
MRTQLFIRVICLVLLVAALGMWAWSYVALTSLRVPGLTMQLNRGRMLFFGELPLRATLDLTQSKPRTDGGPIQFASTEVLGIRYAYSHGRGDWLAFEFPVLMAALAFGIPSLFRWGRFRHFNLRALVPLTMAWDMPQLGAIFRGKFRVRQILTFLNYFFLVLVLCLIADSAAGDREWEYDVCMGSYHRVWAGAHVGLLYIVAENGQPLSSYVEPTQHGVWTEGERLELFQFRRQFSDSTSDQRLAFLGISLRHREVLHGSDHTYFIIPLWYLVVLFGLKPLFALVGRYRRVLKQSFEQEIISRRVCVACGYDLRAHQAGEKCPECGTVVPWVASSPGRGEESVNP